VLQAEGKAGLKAVRQDGGCLVSGRNSLEAYVCNPESPEVTEEVAGHKAETPIIMEQMEATSTVPKSS
jgi:hypothetical protein